MGAADLSLLDILEFIGVVAFALSGALAAAGRRLDVVALCAVAVATGLAGTSVRDLLTGVPVSWLVRPGGLVACLVAAGLVWAVGERPWSGPVLRWCDAAGLAAIAGTGAARAAAGGTGPLASAAVGVLAAAAGGLIRDALVRETPLMLGRPLYLAAAAAGTAVFVMLRLARIDAGAAAAIGVLAAFGLRAGGLRFGWALPGSPDRG